MICYYAHAGLVAYFSFALLGGYTVAFKTRKNESSDFSTPQEMFQDNKLKTIKGILDYQSQMLDHYLTTLNDSSIINKNVAFELPTGSGKTLVGILIAEFQRRKYSRKCLFLCPTNQLVSQVCEQAKSQYGIEAIPFIGKQANYDISSKTRYSLAQAIGVTTYSSFFALFSFFDDPDILIFDDVHSSENYIVDNWSLSLERREHETLFLQIASLLEDAIGESGLHRLRSDDPYSGDIMDWNDLLPRPKLVSKMKELQQLLHTGTSETNLRYSWSRISDNLIDCNIYVSWHSILIRPYIPPTETHKAFSDSSQRIFMSATLGSSGELERLTGCRKIKRLPIVSGWDTKGLGRRLFVFPDLSIKTEAYGEILVKLHQEARHSVLIVPSDNDSRDISEFLARSIDGISIFNANDLISSKEIYCASENATVVMANRFDGVDFPDDESRMLFIYNLPKVTHLQEKFFVGKMAASLLYAERIKTRIVQAVGRCTRNAGDYAVVCILGYSILNDITSAKIQATYHPEMRAEIKFGIDNSTDFKNVDDILENVRLFYERGTDWADAESEIVELRNQFVAEEKNTEQEKIFAKLYETAQIEVDIQYDLWKKNYQSAYEKSIQIVELLNAPSLSGYKCYWQYISGCLSLELEDRSKAKQYFSNAMNNNKGGIRWFSKLVNDVSSGAEVLSDEDFFFDIVGSLEENIIMLQTNNRFEDKVKHILEGLRSTDGLTFERAHKELGGLLGYDAHNCEKSAAPDPYWIINDSLCIVAEDKIYESDSKAIPVDDVTQATRHSMWISEHVKSLRSNAKIITIFVSNSSSIETSARTFCKDIFYVNRKELHEWATRAINSLRTARSRFQEAGDSDWRTNVKDLFIADQTTPQAFIGFVTRRILSDI